MVPHLWHSSLIHGLSVSILVWAQKGEVPDGIVWQATSDARDALFLADDPQIAYLKAEYREENPERLARRIVLASLGELMHVAQQVALTMDRLSSTRTGVSQEHALPNPPSLTDLFAQLDQQHAETERLRAVQEMPTIAWSDLPTRSQARITGDDVSPTGKRQEPPLPPEWRH